MRERTRRRARASVAVAAAMLLPCCTLLVDLDGFTAGSTNGRAETGASADDGAADVFVDGPPGDASPDAGRFCADPGAFCADFDDGLVATGWDETSAASTSTFTLIDSGAPSPPFALSVTSPVTTDTYQDGPFLLKRFVGPLSDWSCSFAFRHAGESAGLKSFVRVDVDFADGSVLSAYVTTGPSFGTFVWVSDPNDGGQRTVKQRVTTVGASTDFRRLRVDLSRTSAALALDGSEIASFAHPTLLPFTLVTLRLGGPILDDVNPKPWAAFFDDVRCTTSP